MRCCLPGISQSPELQPLRAQPPKAAPASESPVDVAGIMRRVVAAHEGGAEDGRAPDAQHSGKNGVAEHGSPAAKAAPGGNGPAAPKGAGPAAVLGLGSGALPPQVAPGGKAAPGPGTNPGPKPSQGPAGLPSLPARPAPRGGLGALPARPTPAGRAAPSSGARRTVPLSLHGICFGQVLVSLVVQASLAMPLIALRQPEKPQSIAAG